MTLADLPEDEVWENERTPDILGVRGASALVGAIRTGSSCSLRVVGRRSVAWGCVELNP